METKEICYWFSFSLGGKNQGVCNIMSTSDENAVQKLKDLNLTPEYDSIKVYTGPEPEIELDRLFTPEEMRAMQYKSDNDLKKEQNE